ncbi:MAG: YbbR-like domain-containing protein [Candidatus Fibromonas sp.]|jgi:YbbR domain-containing protein|nr:YbbR-like domain-containing protein [Candidatus Fibromonas sp.]
MPEKIKDFFVKHSLKLLALLCGCLLWFGVVSREEVRTEMELPVRIVNLQDNMALVYPPPHSMSVQLEGKAISLIHLKINRSASLEIDLKGMPLGQSKVASEQIRFISPSMPEVKMLRVRQINSLNIELDTRIEAKVPVQPRLHIQAAPGFTLLGEPDIIPDSVFISGAMSTISKIKHIPTKEMSITNLKWSNSLPIQLDLSSLHSIVDIADTSLFVQIQIEPLEHKIFSGIPVRLIGNFDRNLYALSPAKAEVEISGGKELLSRVNPQDINLYIEFSRFSIENTDELRPTVHIPYPITSWHILPDKFRLTESIREFGEDIE